MIKSLSIIVLLAVSQTPALLVSSYESEGSITGMRSFEANDAGKDRLVVALEIIEHATTQQINLDPRSERNLPACISAVHCAAKAPEVNISAQKLRRTIAF
jgi:hypothetical protein